MGEREGGEVEGEGAGREGKRGKSGVVGWWDGGGSEDGLMIVVFEEELEVLVS